jgi:hypothetical protein
MRAIVVAIALIGLGSCATYSNEDARQAGPEATPIATSALVGEEEIRPSCEEEWPDDWAMIAGCVERQTRGFQAVRRLLEQHDIRDGDTTPEAQIFSNCSREWRNHLGQPDWAMIAGCVERQTRGFQAVRRLLEQHDIRDGDTTPEAQIFGDCSREWRNRHGQPDWAMIAGCVERQLAGYRRLNPKE